MRPRDGLRRHIDLALRLFVWINLAAVGADVYLAHRINDYHHWAEWIPVAFSALSAALLMPWVIRGGARGWADSLGLSVLGAAVLLGALGFYYHLQSGQLLGQNLRRLVYSAPLLAPLAYAGIGLVGLATRADRWLGLEKRQWLLVLVAAGFLANGALCAIDHAQNGFYYPAEWVSVGAALVAGFCLLFAATRPTLDPAETRGILGLLVLEMIVGAVGAGFHLSANLEAAQRAGLLEGFVFGAPAMAPLLFCDVALLGMLAIVVPGRP